MVVRSSVLLSMLKGLLCYGCATVTWGRVVHFYKSISLKPQNKTIKRNLNCRLFSLSYIYFFLQTSLYFLILYSLWIKQVPRVITNYSYSGTQNTVHYFRPYVFRGSYWSIYKVKEWGILLAQWMGFLLPPGWVNNLNCVRIWQNLKLTKENIKCGYILSGQNITKLA